MKKFLIGTIALVILFHPVRSFGQLLFVSGTTVSGTSGAIYDYTTNGAWGALPNTALSRFLGGMAVDSKGNLFIVDSGNASIYEYSTFKIQSTFATGVSNAWGIAFDTSGNLYVTSGGDILEYTTNGVESTFATGLYGLRNLAFDGAGNLYATALTSNAATGLITKYTTNGTQSIFATGLHNPQGLGFSTDGNLFVADTSANNIGSVYEYTTNGVQSTYATGLNAANGITFDTSGNLYVANRPNVIKYTTNNVYSLIINSGEISGNLAWSPYPIPEPSSYVLLGLAALALIVAYRKKAA